MKVAVNGVGVAGPTFAYWLKKYGFEPVLFEKAPKLRTGGYIIDFWGVGYDIAERMGILPELNKKGYLVQELRLVDDEGRKKVGMDMSVLVKLVNNRYVSIARSDLAAAIYHACGDVDARFGVSIVGIEQNEDGVVAELSNGKKEKFDLVVGADGLHSKVREVVFGTEEKFEKHLGYYVAAFELPNYQPRDELTYMMHSPAKKSVARFSMRDDITLFLFVFRSELIEKEPETEKEEKETIRKVFEDIGWEAGKILDRMQEVEDVYFDRVSQIHMDSWTKGRVALIGDAASCASLLAGEGTGLAMIQAYILAGELKKADGDYKKAFENYEKKLRGFISDKQKSAEMFGGFFAPKSKLSQKIRDLGVRLASTPFLANFIIGRSLRDDIELPEYK